MWPLLLLIPILARCSGSQAKQNVELKKINDLDGHFVRLWNKSASDGVISPDEFRGAGQLARQTLGNGDDAFVDNLTYLTEFPSQDVGEALQRQMQLDSIKTSAAKFGLTIYNLKVVLSNTPTDTRVIETGANISGHLTGRIQIYRR